MKITKEDREGLKKVFGNFGRAKTDEEIFYDLCFCLCAPQTTFKSNTKVIANLKTIDFYNTPLEDLPAGCHLQEIVKPVRYYRNKTKYLLEAKKKFPKILKIVRDFENYNKMEDIPSLAVHRVFRELLVKKVKGLGMKAASHFLRNLGDNQLAIIDTHIIKYLKKSHNMSIKPVLSKAYYEFLENLFILDAGDYNLSVVEFDAILWKNYSGTDWEDFKY